MNAQLRYLALFKQGLLSQQFGAGLSGTLNAIENLAYVQIDTLSVVERAHHHVLWNRVADYDPTHLNQLVKKQHIFEYWYHAAAYLPMCDYRYALPRMMSIRNDENRYYTNVDKRLMGEILARVRAEGELRVRDIGKSNQKKGGWWNLGQERRALDKLFMQGDLMICERNGMEKIYDLAERCLPQNIDLSMPTLREYAIYLLETTLRAHGVFTLKQLLHLRTGKSLQDMMREVLSEYISSGVVSAISNIGRTTIYVDNKALELGERTVKTNAQIKILSPFDNLVIHRERLSLLFNFDYRIECYTAAAKRVFGYFCLPILYGDTFIGRVDCKAHRAEQRFEVIKLHLENDEFDQKQLLLLLRNELQRFADFNKCPLLEGI
ncbi:MAG: winged helix-turn-helix domain-containing protein [Neisseriales bacterium]|nr:MAG: winged helix-turn-helix domain-containing protein [Neisseriales bacterium]